MSKSLGLEITFPSGTLSHHLNGRQPEHSLDDDDSKDHSKSDHHGTGASVDNINQSDDMDDDDRMIMPFVPPDTEDELGMQSGNENDEGGKEGYSDNDYTEEDDTISLDNLSTTPPSSMPLLAVELDKLCGYTPSNVEETKRLTIEVCEALLGSKIYDSENQNSGDDAGIEHKISQYGDQRYGDDLSFDFMSRASEMLETGIARHTDSSWRHKMDDEVDDKCRLNYAFVPYPEFLPLPSSERESEDSPSMISTSKVWKRIMHPHEIPIVNRLLVLLSKCSRDLLWKHEMTMEIRRVAKEERKYQEERKCRNELKVWRKKKRPEELSKLYDVRETFVMKLGTLRTNYENYVREREKRVQRELQLRKDKGVGMGGIAGLDWDGKVTFAFGDDVEVILKKMMLEKKSEDFGINTNDNGNYHDFAEDEFDEDDEKNSGSSVDNDQRYFSGDDNNNYDQSIPKESNDIFSKGVSSFPQTSPDERRKRRAKAASRRIRKRLEAEREKEKEQELRAKIKTAHDEEENVRLMCISTDEKLAMVMVKNMEERLEKVDELLDDLQMEAWQDEEDGVLDEDSSDEDENIADENDGEMTLLDRILAMILGATPPSTKDSDHEHFNFLKEEHESIVQFWKDAFGRLPKLEQNSPSKSSQQKSNEEVMETQDIGHWDDDDFDDIKTPMESMNHKAPFTLNLGGPVPDDWEDEADCDDAFSSAFTDIESNNLLSNTTQTQAQEDAPFCDDTFSSDFTAVASNNLLSNTIQTQAQASEDKVIRVKKVGLRPGGRI